jgi:hypothetical protein
MLILRAWKSQHERHIRNHRNHRPAGWTLLVAVLGMAGLESLAHSERETADALAGYVLKTDELNYLRHAGSPDAVGLGQGEQVVVGRAAGVDGAGLEHRADLVQWRRELGIVASVNGDVARRRRVQPEDQAHGG